MKCILKYTLYIVYLFACFVPGFWLLLANGVSDAHASSLTFHAAWASSMYQLLPPLGSNYSCRFVARTSLGGRAVRIRLSNLMGAVPLSFGTVFLGLRTTGAALSTNMPVTFGGSTAITIPPHEELSSDPVPLAVTAGQDLAVSVYVPDASEPVTDHVKSFVTSYCTNTQGGGNQAATLSSAPYTRPIYDMYWLTAVDVYGAAGGTVVTLGDSITNGSASTYDGNNRWTDVLSRRLLDEPAWHIKSVANASISGNELCASNPYDGSPSALARLSRDVLHQSGVTHVILFEGTNDLAYGEQAHTGLSADDVIACMKGIVERVHAAGLTITGATIIPRSFDNVRESARQRVNAWIRTSGAFDSIIDFDAVVRDPNNPATIAPIYDSGDHIHPNSAGHAAMGEAVGLSLFD
jgi:lysophospholipase L1-like esterase